MADTTPRDTPEADYDAGPPNDVLEGAARCVNCWYVIEGLDRNRCPECGRFFDLSNPTTFTRKPPFVFWRMWLPGSACAVAAGVLTFAVLLTTGSTGFALTLATPVMIGALIGYRCRVRRLLHPILILSALIGVLAMLIALDVAGLLCSVIAFGIIAVPALLGAACGFVLRVQLKKSRFDQSAYLPVILLFLMPFGLAALEALVDFEADEEVVRTSRALPGSPDRLWERLAFYEDLPDPGSWLLRFAGPRPVRTRVQEDDTGITRTCFYEKGYLTKRMTEISPSRRLAFIITEQHIGEERSVRLIGGSFTLVPADGDETRVTLTTRYEPRLRPRVCWRPFERWIAHAVHDHVLDGMARDPFETPALASNQGDPH